MNICPLNPERQHDVELHITEHFEELLDSENDVHIDAMRDYFNKLLDGLDLRNRK